jgi:iron complex transport system permease protein
VNATKHDAQPATAGWHNRRASLLLAGSAITVLFAVMAIGWGSFRIPAADAAAILWKRVGGMEISGNWPASWETVILDIRLPRVILAALVGAALAAAGAVYQGLFRNPLADPYLIGVSSGAGLGATIAIAFGLQLGWSGLGAVSLLAFGGALSSTTLVYLLSRVGGRTSVATLLLAGIALSSLLSAMTTFLMFRAQDAFRTVHVMGWLMGSFALANWTKAVLMAVVLALGGAVIWSHGHRLNVLQLDEEQAHQLGIPVAWTQLVLIVAASLITATAVSVSGVVGFVGLIVPHAVRLVWGPDFRFLIPMGALCGAMFTMMADGLARTLLSPSELPVGVVTAFCGAPFFLYLLRRRRNLAW